MNRTFTVAASLVALVALGACSRGDETAYDTAAGATAGAMATPPAPIGMSVGATTSVGLSTGATTSVIDTTKKVNP